MRIALALAATLACSAYGTPVFAAPAPHLIAAPRAFAAHVFFPARAASTSGLPPLRPLREWVPHEPPPSPGNGTPPNSSPASPSAGGAGRRVEPVPTTLPEFANPLKRHRMAMPGLPAAPADPVGDYAF